MAKSASTAVLDAPLDVIAAATEMYYCNGQPTSRADAITRQSAPAITLTSGDFAKSGTTNRVLTVAAKSTTATVAQSTDHVALCTSSALVLVTTAPVQNTNVGATVSSASFTVTNPAVV